MLKKIQAIATEPVLAMIPPSKQGGEHKPLSKLVHRSTLSPTIALAFKPMFDNAIATHRDQLIKVQGAPKNFRIRASEALRYCILYLDYDHLDGENREHKSGDYAKLRGKIRFKFEDVEQTTLRLHFIGNVIPFDFIEVQCDMGWKQKFLDFISSPTLDTPLELLGLKLSEDNQFFVKEKIQELNNLIQSTCTITSTVDAEKILIVIQAKV